MSKKETWDRLLKDNATKIMVVGSIGGTIIIILYGSAILANAVVLAAITVTSGAFLFSKLPQEAKKWLLRHGVFADIIAAGITYVMLGKTITALLAAGIVGGLTSLLLWMAKPLVLNEKKDIVIEFELV